jgi:hypothetical protein
MDLLRRHTKDRERGRNRPNAPPGAAGPVPPPEGAADDRRVAGPAPFVPPPGADTAVRDEREAAPGPTSGPAAGAGTAPPPAEEAGARSTEPMPVTTVREAQTTPEGEPAVAPAGRHDDRDAGVAPVERREVVGEVVVRRWSIADALVALIGAALAVVGGIALARAEVDSTWFRPVVDVLDADHTALLGVAELGAGILLILVAAARSRALAILLGVALAVAAAVAAVESAEVRRELAIEDWWAWLLCGAGVLVALTALIPRRGRVERIERSERIER